jgi:hypothetical protein
VLGYTLFGQQRIGDSITALAKSLQLNVKNADAHRLLGRNLMLIGRFDVAQTSSNWPWLSPAAEMRMTSERFFPLKITIRLPGAS